MQYSGSYCLKKILFLPVFTPAGKCGTGIIGNINRVSSICGFLAFFKISDSVRKNKNVKTGNLFL
jgi:hypothetical protein